MTPEHLIPGIIEAEYRDLQTLDAAALIDQQHGALRRLEEAKKRVAATRGRPLCVQKLADDKLLDAFGLVEEFNALELDLS